MIEWIRIQYIANLHTSFWMAQHVFPRWDRFRNGKQNLISASRTSAHIKTNRYLQIGRRWPSFLLFVHNRLHSIERQTPVEKTSGPVTCRMREVNNGSPITLEVGVFHLGSNETFHLLSGQLFLRKKCTMGLREINDQLNASTIVRLNLNRNLWARFLYASVNTVMAHYYSQKNNLLLEFIKFFYGIYIVVCLSIMISEIKLSTSSWLILLNYLTNELGSTIKCYMQ